MYTPQLDWISACRFLVIDPQWRRKVWLGGWILLLPLIGWPAVLGYRKVAIDRLVQGTIPVLPDWGRGLWFYAWEGCKAMLVINGYYLPVYAWVGYRLSQAPQSAEIPWGWLALFFAVLPIFSTLITAAVLGFAQFYVSEPIFGWGEVAAITLAVSLLTFFIPAGFLNVSRTGRYLAAFDIPYALGFIRRHFRTYLECWIGSGVIAILAHAAVPFSPWGVVWCYLVIVYAFNEIPLIPTGTPPEYLQRSWFPRFRQSLWTSFPVATQGRFLCHYRQPEDQPLADCSPHFTCLIFGPIHVPVK